MRPFRLASITLSTILLAAWGARAEAATCLGTGVTTCSAGGANVCTLTGTDYACNLGVNGDTWMPGGTHTVATSRWRHAAQ